jgi:hypothetical protein
MFGTFTDVNYDDLRHQNEQITTYVFIKEAGQWYIDLPNYQEEGWLKNDLKMTEGARKLLNLIAHGHAKCTLRLSTMPFKGADVLELVELCEAPRGGGIYLMETAHGRQVNAMIWICDIALFVFGDLPQQIYLQQVKE